MNKTTNRLVILFGVVSLGAALVQHSRAQTPAAANGPMNGKVETVASFPAPGNTENIGQAPDGSLYVTGMTDRILWKVSPDGRVDKFFTMPSLAAFVGVAVNKKEIVLGVCQRPFLLPSANGGPPKVDMAHTGSQVLVLDHSGKVKATIDAQEGEFLNGIAQAGDRWYLIADTNGTALLRVDTAKKTIEPWLKDDLLARANGIKVFKKWVYVGTQGDKIYRVQIGSDGKPEGSLALFEQGVRTDDFGMAPDGTIFIPTGTTVMKVSPTGETSQFLDNVPNGASAWVTKDGKWLYWPTRAGPAHLLKVALK